MFLAIGLFVEPQLLLHAPRAHTVIMPLRGMIIFRLFHFLYFLVNAVFALLQFHSYIHLLNCLL
jgi:hypothetical protein